MENSQLSVKRHYGFTPAVMELLEGKSVTRNISLPGKLNEALLEQARREDRNVSRVIRRALLLYLEHQYFDDVIEAQKEDH